MNEEITGILENIEKELGYYKRDDQTDPFDVNLIEKQISRVYFNYNHLIIIDYE